jgi:hypothetical protein
LIPAQTDPLQVWEVLEGVGLNRCNFIFPEFQVLDHSEVLTENTVSNGCQSVTVQNHYAVQSRKIIQHLLREEFHPRWFLDINDRRS